MSATRVTMNHFLVRPQYTAFLVPEVYVHDKRDALTAVGLKTRWRQVDVGLLRFRALEVHIGGRTVVQRIPRMMEAISRLFPAQTALESFAGTASDRILPVVAPQEVQVHFVDSRQKPLKGEDELAQKAQDGYMPLMRRLAQVSGLALTYHRHDERIIPPTPDDGIIHLWGNSCPPGENQTWYRETVFGLPVSPNKDENRATGYGPTAGRGLILLDEDARPVLQILRNNWYILFPVISYFNDLTSVQIFERLLALGWGAVQSGAKPERPLSRRKFLRTAPVWTKGSTTYIQEQAQEVREQIAQMTQRLAELHRQLERWIGFEKGVENNPFSTRTRRALPGELKSIQVNPLVEGLDLHPEAIHVRTKPIVVSHEGVDYAVGTFVIRINNLGALMIWGETPTHPQGVPHPHIAKHGSPCYGNAGTAIARAAGEARYADAIEYVLTWLTRGYSPSLAETKIEEWPIATQEATDAT